MPHSKKISAGPSADLISALPDALLQHVLSFLQSREAVQTCVLARRWRHLWKSMPVLRITDGACVTRLHKFMDHLLLLRDRSNLDICLFRCVANLPDDWAYLSLWIRHSLLCQVGELSIAGSFMPRNVSFVSQHLTKLQLSGARLYVNKFTDFSSCPALKDLEMTSCIISVDKVCTTSLERLNCHDCLFSSDWRVHISAPSLISLQLINFGGRTPFLYDMPVLVTAAVTFGSDCEDFCKNNDPGYCEDASCDWCYGLHDDKGSVLLNSFSSARNLKLIAEPGMFILKRDLRWCPSFHKLEILLLSEWCVADDHRALICILQHSPVLKNLTLQLYKKVKPKSIVQSKAIFKSVATSFASDNLEKVEIKCHEVDERVHNILMSLVTYGIHLKKISIQQKNKSSQCFSYVCTGISSIHT